MREWIVRRQGIVVPLVALALAFAVGAVLIRLQGVNPTYAYRTLFGSALLTPDGLLRTLQKTTPLVLSGLAVAVALRVGLFNIGAQGQLLWGAIAAAWVGVRLAGAPAAVIVSAAVLASVVAGAVWAGIAGVLKATRGVHEVISTIMLNSIAAGIIDYLVSGPLKAPGQVIPRTAPIDPAARLPDLGVVPVEPQPGLLHRVGRLVGRAEHPVGHRLQARPVRLEARGQGVRLSHPSRSSPAPRQYRDGRPARRRDTVEDREGNSTTWPSARA